MKCTVTASRTLQTRKARELGRREEFVRGILYGLLTSAKGFFHLLFFCALQVYSRISCWRRDLSEVLLSMRMGIPVVHGSPKKFALYSASAMPGAIWRRIVLKP